MAELRKPFAANSGLHTRSVHNDHDDDDNNDNYIANRLAWELVP